MNPACLRRRRGSITEVCLLYEHEGNNHPETILVRQVSRLRDFGREGRVHPETREEDSRLRQQVQRGVVKQPYSERVRIMRCELDVCG